jgi:hypothetical protein
MIQMSSVIVNDLDVGGSGFSPTETDTVLVVDPNRMLSCSITLQLLQPETRKRKRVEGDGRTQLVESTTGATM